MPVCEVLEAKVEAPEGGDEGAGDAVHHHHGEDQQHPGVLLTEPFVVYRDLF